MPWKKWLDVARGALGKWGASSKAIEQFSERRQGPRLSVDIPVVVFSQGQRILGSTCEVGQGGLSVHLPRPLAGGQLVQVETLDPVAPGLLKRIPCLVKWSASKDWAWQVGLHCNLSAEKLEESWLRAIFEELQSAPTSTEIEAEKRRHKRHDVSLNVEVEVVASSENLTAQCVNIGHGGCRLVLTQESLHLEQYLRLRFGTGGLAMTALCKVVNIQPTGDGRQWVGLAFAQAPSGIFSDFIDSCDKPAMPTAPMTFEQLAAKPTAKMEPVAPAKKIALDWEPPPPKSPPAPEGDERVAGEQGSELGGP